MANNHRTLHELDAEIRQVRDQLNIADHAGDQNMIDALVERETALISAKRAAQQGSA